MKDAFRSVSKPRALTSARFPIGVATTNRVPGIRALHSRVECVWQVLQHGVPPAADHRDDVEADHLVVKAVGEQVVERGLHHSALLTPRNAVGWIAPDRARSHPHLDEAERAVLLRHEVQLTVAAAKISRPDRVTLRLQHLRSRVLAFTSKTASIVRRCVQAFPLLAPAKD